MTTQLDRELREALEDLVSTRPPSGLAERAVRRAVRRRRAMRVTSAVACLAVAGGVVTVSRAESDLGDSWPSASLEVQVPPSTQRQFVLAALSYVPVDSASSNTVRSMVLNRQTGEYLDLPYRSALPSPDGTRVAVADGTYPTQLPERVGVLSLATGQVEWIPGSAGYYPEDWSPDGRQLILTHVAEDEPREFAVVDLADLSQAPQRRRADVDPVWVAWGPDGGSLLVAQIEEDRLQAIVRLGLDGRRLSSIPLNVRIVHPGLLVSDDGSRAVVATAGNAAVVVDTVTGALAEVPLAGRPLGWVGNHWLLASVGDGREEQAQSLSVIDLTGQVTLRVPVPRPAQTIMVASVGSSSGLGLAARRWVF